MVHDRTSRSRVHGLSSFSTIYLVVMVFILQALPLDPIRGTDAESIQNIPEFQKLRVYYESSPLARGAIGDALPLRPGNELITCSFGGIVTATYGSGDSWTSETVYKAYYGDSKEIVQVNSVAVTDVIPERQGDEVLTVGNDMNLRLSIHNGTGWQTSVIYSDVDWLYEVSADDIDGDGQKEIAIVGETKTLTVLHREGKRWNGTVVARDTYLLEACAIHELDPDHAGKEIVSGGKSGRLILVYQDIDVYRQKTIALLSTDITDISVSDMDPSVPGAEIYVSLRNGKVYCVSMGPGSEWTMRVIHDEGDIIYGMEAGELVPGTPILLTASYKHRLGLISYKDSGFSYRTIYSEEWNILGSAIGNLDPTHLGNELFSLSQLGRLTMLFYDPEGLEVSLPFTITNAGPGEALSIPFAVKPKGGLEGTCTISVKGISGAASTLRSIEIPGAASIRIVAPSSPGVYTLNISAAIGTKYGSADLALTVSEGSPQVTISPEVVLGSVAKDRENRFSTSVVSGMGLPSPMLLSISPYPSGMAGVLNRTSCMPCDIPEQIAFTVSADPSTIPGRYILFMIGRSDQVQRATAFVLDITEEAISDFRLEVTGSAEDIPFGGMGTVELRVISENGFDSIVNISAGPVPMYIELTLSNDRIEPTGNITIKVSGNATGGPYLIPIIVRSGPTEKTIYFKVSFKEKIIPPTVVGPPSPITPESDSNGIATWRFLVRLDPGSAPLKRVQLRASSLPADYNISFRPSLMGPLLYPLNITVTIWGPSAVIPQTTNISFVDIESGKEYSASVEFIRTPDEGHGIGPSLPVVYILIGIALFGSLVALLYLYNRRSSIGSNPLKTDERMTHGHDRPDLDRKGNASRELSNSGRIGMDRSIGKLR